MVWLWFFLPLCYFDKRGEVRRTRVGCVPTVAVSRLPKHVPAVGLTLRDNGLGLEVNGCGGTLGIHIISARGSNTAMLINQSCRHI